MHNIALTLSSYFYLLMKKPFGHHFQVRSPALKGQMVQSQKTNPQHWESTAHNILFSNGKKIAVIFIYWNIILLWHKDKKIWLLFLYLSNDIINYCVFVSMFARCFFFLNNSLIFSRSLFKCYFTKWIK